MNEELENALKIVLDDLEDNNNHTLGKLLYWAYFEEKLSAEKAIQCFEAWMLARDFLYYGKTCDNPSELKGYSDWLTLRDKQNA